MLEQSVGGHENAMGGVAEQLINDQAAAAIDDADIIFLEEPQFNVDTMLEEGKPFVFSVSGPVPPEMKLTSYEPVHIEMPPEKATETEIERQIQDLRDYYHSFEPIDDPIKLLLFSFGLGILHLFLGLAAHFYQLWHEGKKWDAVWDVIPVYIIILGVAPVGAGLLTTVPPILTKIGLGAMAFGVVLFVVTGGRSRKGPVMRLLGGVYALYNVATGYLGDILSYSRLLALGLATGSIAGVFNLIVTMPSNPVLKIVMMCTVGVVAHIANLAINLLGAYVHTDRLQFVELFSKFYEGGGKAFAPLKANTKHFRFEKENIYHD